MNIKANYLSVLRIIIAPFLLITKPLSLEFFLIYFIAGLSDILDGYIARKTKTTSKIGEKLDSFGDFLLFISMVIVLLPILNISYLILNWIILIGIIKIISIIIGYFKYKQFSLVHTFLNKFSGLLLMTLAILLLFMKSDIVIYFICIITTIAAIEELIIILSTNDLNLNRKSLFIKNL